MKSCFLATGRIFTLMTLAILLGGFIAQAHAAVSPNTAIVQEEHLIIMKFREGSNIRLDRAKTWQDDGGAVFTHPANLNLSDFTALLQSNHLVAVSPIFDRHDNAYYDQLEQRLEQQTGKNLPNLNLHIKLTFPRGIAGKNLVAQLAKLPYIEDAHIHTRVAPPAIPNDPNVDNLYYSGQWYLYRTKVDQAWNYGTGKGVVIADCDGGFELSHEDLAANFLTDLAEDYGFPGDTVANGVFASHGTFVMGIMDAVGNNRKGIAGGGYDAKVIPLQYSNYDSTDTVPLDQGIANCTLGAAEKGGQIIVLEAQSGTGSGETWPAVRDAAATVVADGHIVIAAAGNYDAELTSEAAYDTGSIIVGASDINNQRAIWSRGQASNYGKRVDVAAPGDTMYSTAMSNSYEAVSGGTSGATPVVVGAVAIMLEANPRLTPAKARDIIRQTRVPLNTDKPIGGLLDAENAVRVAKGFAPIPYTQPTTPVDAPVQKACALQSTSHQPMSALLGLVILFGLCIRRIRA